MTPVDKIFAELDGRPLIEHVIEPLQTCGFVIVISSNHPEKFAQYPYRVIKDTIPGLGPLQALCGLLKEIGCSRLLLAAADMPFLQRRVIEKLWAIGLSADVAVLEREGRCSPVPGVYSQASGSEGEHRLKQQRRDLKSLFESALKICSVPEDVWRADDASGRTVHNINTVSDWVAASESHTPRTFGQFGD